MAELEVAGCRLFYAVDGPPDRPVLLLSNPLGSTLDVWDAQLPRFAREYRVLRYDIRGHGRSKGAAGPCTLERLGRDALAVLDAVGARRAHVCGVSIGGLTGLWLGAHAPERVDRLVLANTAARIATAELWQERIRVVQQQGLAPLVEATLERWFSPEFRAQRADRVEAFRAMLAACPADGYAACCAALRDADLREDLHRIAAPALVVVGTRDPATTPADGRLLQERIAGARLLELDALHLSHVECAEAFSAAVLAFLRGERE